MESSVQDINAVQRRLKVDLTPALVNDAFAVAYRDYQKKARINGYRPGKVPMPIIKKMFKESVAADVADKLIRKHLFEAIEKNELRPIASPALETIELPKPDESYSFTAVIDVLPPIEAKDYKGLEVVCHKHEVTDNLIQEELVRVQKQAAKKRAVADDHVVSVGNVVTISQKTEQNGTQVDYLTRDDLSFEVGAKQTFPEIDAAVVGLKKGESKTVVLAIPGRTEEEKAGETKATITVKSVEELVLPAIDDDLAKDIGFADLAEAKEKIKESYAVHFSRNRKNELENGITEQLLAKNDIEVPPAMVANVIDDMIEQMRWPSDSEKNKAKADQEFRKRMIEPAKKRAKTTLLLWDIATRENVTVTDDDVESSLKEMLQQNGNADVETPDNKALIEKMKANVGDGFRDNLRIEKTVKLLIDAAKITEHTHAPGETCAHN